MRLVLPGDALRKEPASEHSKHMERKAEQREREEPSLGHRV